MVLFMPRYAVFLYFHLRLHSLRSAHVLAHFHLPPPSSFAPFPLLPSLHPPFLYPLFFIIFPLSFSLPIYILPPSFSYLLLSPLPYLFQLPFSWFLHPTFSCLLPPPFLPPPLTSSFPPYLVSFLPSSSLLPFSLLSPSFLPLHHLSLRHFRPSSLLLSSHPHPTSFVPAIVPSCSSLVDIFALIFFSFLFFCI